MLIFKVSNEILILKSRKQLELAFSSFLSSPFFPFFFFTIGLGKKGGSNKRETRYIYIEWNEARVGREIKQKWEAGETRRLKSATRDCTVCERNTIGSFRGNHLKQRISRADLILRSFLRSVRGAAGNRSSIQVTIPTYRSPPPRKRSRA